MLSKTNRLQKNKDFDEVFKKGKGFKEDFLFLKFLGNNLEVSRFGFVVSNKVSNKATVRNRIKRVLRELVQKKLPNIKKGIDVVLVVNNQIKGRETGEIEKVIEKAFLKTNLYDRPNL